MSHCDAYHPDEEGICQQCGCDEREHGQLAAGWGVATSWRGVELELNRVIAQLEEERDQAYRALRIVSCMSDEGAAAWAAGWLRSRKLMTATDIVRDALMREGRR